MKRDVSHTDHKHCMRQITRSTGTGNSASAQEQNTSDPLLQLMTWITSNFLFDLRERVSMLL